MTGTSLTLSLLLSSAFGFMENNLLQLFDCCGTHYQGVVMLIDRDNQEYGQARDKQFDRRYPLTSSLRYALLLRNYQDAEKSYPAPIIVSQSILKALILWNKNEGRKPKLDNKCIIKKVEDFFVILPINWQNSPFGPYLNKNMGPDVPWGIVEKIPVLENNKSFVEVLSQIFLKAEPVGFTTHTLNWLVYASGHGFKDQVIGLPIKEFKEFTDFLQQKISTQMLIYLTCYGGGENREKGFIDETVKRNYPYTIVTLSSAESITRLPKENVLNFTLLFKELTRYFLEKKDDASKVYDILKRAQFMSLKDDLLLENIPQLKFPYGDYFVPSPLGVFNKHEIVTISEVQAQTRTQDLAIDPACKLIFVATIDPEKKYTYEVPYTINFPLDFSKFTNRTPRLIFSNFKNEYYRFKKLYAPSFTFKELCTLFLPFGEGQEYNFSFDAITYKQKDLKEATLQNAHLFIRITGFGAKKAYRFTMRTDRPNGGSDKHDVAECPYTERLNQTPVFT